MAEDLKNEDHLKNEDDLKSYDNLINEEKVILVTVPGQRATKIV